MKILYVASSAIPAHSASSVHVMKMGQALSKNGHAVAILAPEYNRPDTGFAKTINAFNYYGVNQSFTLCHGQESIKGRAGIFIFMIEVLLKSTKLRPDLIYSRCLFSAWVASFIGIPIIFERHDSFIKGTKAEKIFMSLLKKKSLNKIVVISHALKENLCLEYHIADTKIIVAADGSDPIPNNNPKPKIEKSTTSVGYVGHLYPGRGIEIILDLAEEFPAIKFHIIGGLKNDIEHWQDKSQKITNISWYGHLTHAQAAQHLLLFDIVLAPYQRKVTVSGGAGDTSRWMSPLKIFEYMAAAKPIICSNIAVLKEVLEDKKNCLLCEPDNLSSWSSALKTLIENPAFANKIANQAYIDFIKEYTWDARVKKILPGNVI